MGEGGKGKIECGGIAYAAYTQSNDHWTVRSKVCWNDVTSSGRIDAIFDYDNDGKADIMMLGMEYTPQGGCEKSLYTDDKWRNEAEKYCISSSRANGDQAAKYQAIFDKDRKQAVVLLKWFETALKKGGCKIIPVGEHRKGLGFKGPDGKSYKVPIAISDSGAGSGSSSFTLERGKGKNDPSAVDMAKALDARSLLFSIEHFDDQARRGVDVSYNREDIPEPLKEKLWSVVKKFLPPDDDQK